MHFRIQPGWPPPESLPARGVASPNGMPSPNWLYSLSGPCLEALLVAQFDAAEIEHAVLHGAEHLLAAAGAVALIERGDDAEREMQPGAAIADLRAGDQRRAVAEAGGRGRAAGALRDVLVDLAVLVWPGAEALDRGDDHARIELVDVLPGEAHAVERAGREILHQHVALLDQRVEDALALRVLGVDRDRALVVVEHREVERVRALHVANCPRVMSPTPGRSTLMTSAPNQASSCVQVGPDCTCVKSRMRTPVERLAVLAVRLARRPRQTIAVAVCLRCYALLRDLQLRRLSLDDAFFAALSFFVLSFLAIFLLL